MTEFGFLVWTEFIRYFLHVSTCEIQKTFLSALPSETANKAVRSFPVKVV